MEKLTPFQVNVLNECIKKKYGGLSLNMGQGKTFLGLSLSKSFNSGNGKSIIVVSKNLVGNWVHELKKFFGDSLPYLVFHQNKIKNIESFKYSDLNASVIIVTPEVLSKFYKKYTIQNKFLGIEQVQVQGGRFVVESVLYNQVNNCFLQTDDGTLGAALYNKEWSSLIVDEGQNHTNIKSGKCQAICSVFSKHRWVMSGTLFNEPRPERILGYYCMINCQSFPRTLPRTEAFIRSKQFKGINNTLVTRTATAVTNENGVVNCNQQIVTHQLSREEQLIYTSMKNILDIIRRKFAMYKYSGDIENMRKFSTYLLSMLTNLRQSIVCPMIVLAKCSLDMIDCHNKSELSTMIYTEMNNLGLKDYLDDPDSVKSSRIKSVISKINQHPNDNITVFTCYRTSIDVMKTFMPTDRKVLTIDGSMSLSKRERTIDEFKLKSDGKGHILFLTYDIGAEGLNLQESNTVILVDLYWNDGKSKQAIARVLRSGQMHDTVNVYVFTSNTGVEKAVFKKQDEKLDIIKEMYSGTIKSKISRIDIHSIIKLIDMHDCVNSLSTKFPGA